MTELVFGGAMWLAVPVAVLAGLVSFLSPCVLPLVPGYLGFIGGAAAPRRVAPASTRQEISASSAAPAAPSGGSGSNSPVEFTPRGRLVLGVVLFIAGFTVVFMAVTILGGTLGRFFLQYADPITRVLGVVVILLGLVFIGVFGFAQRTVHPHVRGNLGLIGAPLLGLAMGVGWTPCIGPTLASRGTSATRFAPASWAWPTRSGSGSPSSSSPSGSDGRRGRWRSCAATSAPSTSSAVRSWSPSAC